MADILKAPFDKLRLLTLSIRMSDQEKTEIQGKADRYSGGNLSNYMRCAAVYYTPQKKHMD